MPPKRIDSPNADGLKELVSSLLARIDDLVEQKKALLTRIDEINERNKALLARIAELEGRAGKPPKTPTNSSLPPSSGQKANVANKSGRKNEVPQGPTRCCARALSEPRRDARLLCRALRLRTGAAWCQRRH